MRATRMRNACEWKTERRRRDRLGRPVSCRLDSARCSNCWRRACPVKRSRPGSGYRRVRSSPIAKRCMRDFVRGVDPRPSRTHGACLCYLEVREDRTSMQRSALIIGASRGLGWGWPASSSDKAGASWGRSGTRNGIPVSMISRQRRETPSRSSKWISRAKRILPRCGRVSTANDSTCYSW